jgi:beta-lactamase regulating signal transducer with metallopeptidase domain
MSPALWLHFASLFLSYFLEIAVVYVVCCILGCLLRMPHQRFFLWMGFLLGAGTYWLGLIGSEFFKLLSQAATAGNISSDAATAWTHSFLVPLEWGRGLLLAGQTAFTAYLVTVPLLAGVAAWRHLALRLLLRRAREPSQALARLFDETCRDFKVSRSRLLIIDGLRSPATAGWWNPRILLPEVCEQLGPTPQLADVLYHELFHVARRDYLWSGLSDLICRILFFHPAAWLARKRLRLQGELACDMAVVAARPGHRADYADSLAYFVRLGMLQEGIIVGVDFAAPPSTLAMRIRSILSAPEPLPRWKTASRMAAGLALVVSFSILSPALNILLDFSGPVPRDASSPLKAPESAVAVHHRHLRHARNSNSSVLPQPQNQDSLTSLRVQPLVRESSVYRRTASDISRPDAAPGELDKRGWNETVAPPRTVSSILLSTVTQIPVGKPPRKNDHDRDDR